MQAFSTKKTIGCIGKCTSGLKPEELDLITDNIHKTLTHPRGREIFRRYLERCQLTDNLECLDLYETCSKLIEKEQHCRRRNEESCVESLTEDVMSVKEMAMDLDGVPQIDRALLVRFNEAADSHCRYTLLAVLEDTKNRTRDHLRLIHDSFKSYVSEPCSMTK